MSDRDKIGGLNPIYGEKFSQRVRTHLDTLKLNVQSKMMAAAYATEKENISFGSVRGVVVHVNLEPETDPWFINASKQNNSVNIHVRIPEIHGYMLNPAEYSGEEKINIAKSYPVFIGTENGDRIPKEGDVVLVDFYSNEKSLGGTYKSIVSKVEDMGEFYEGSDSKNDFWGGTMQRLKGKEVVGDGIYVPGNGKKYEIIKGYFVDSKTSFLNEEIDQYLTDKPLPKDAIKKLIFIISSKCSTTPQFVSTQDRLTIGFRRLASPVPKDPKKVDGLDRLLRKHYGVTTEDVIKNNYAKAIEISEDPRWVKIQVDDYISSLSESLSKHEFKKGREIALWERIKNSAPAWLVPRPKTYEQMKQIYINNKGEKGVERITEIERYIGENEIWR